MIFYSAPLGNAVNFQFEKYGYTAPAGNEVNFEFNNGYDDFCEDSFGLVDSEIDVVVFLDSVSEWFQVVEGPLIDLSFMLFVADGLSEVDELSSRLIAGNIVTSILDTSEILVAYIPTGIIQMLSNPFVITEIESTGVDIEEILSPVILTKVDQAQVAITEIIESVKIIEVL